MAKPSSDNLHRCQSNGWQEVREEYAFEGFAFIDDDRFSIDYIATRKFRLPYAKPVGRWLRRQLTT
jgi:hypothetical protein|tara:strand:+ start:186 stop:383 length:198 start_codon:yes stop_codon:yes gene_type:complete